jgi:hypothetical protein
MRTLRTRSSYARSAERHASDANANAHFHRALRLLGFGADDAHSACTICLESDPPPIQSGLRVPIRHGPCARRLRDREGGGAAKTPRQLGVVGVPDVRFRRSRGAMRAALAESWWARVRHEPEENRERLAAADTLAQALESDWAVRRGGAHHAARIRREEARAG